MDAIDIGYILRRAGIKQEHIAELAGVKQATVSRAIHGKTPGPDVWRVIRDQLGYDPRERESLTA